MNFSPVDAPDKIFTILSVFKMNTIGTNMQLWQPHLVFDFPFEYEREKKNQYTQISFIVFRVGFFSPHFRMHTFDLVEASVNDSQYKHIKL